MNDSSTYGRDFPGKRGQRRASYAPKHTAAPNIEFSGESSYRTAFDTKEIPKRHVREKAKAIASVPFDGTSTHRADFVSHKIGPRAAAHRKAPWQNTADDRAFETEQRAQFYKKAAAGNGRCPAMDLQNKPTRRRSGHSIFKEVPVGKSGAKWEPCHKGQATLGDANGLTGYAVKGTYEGHLSQRQQQAAAAGRGGMTPRMTPPY